jgi:hypothetical protein
MNDWCEVAPFSAVLIPVHFAEHDFIMSCDELARAALPSSAVRPAAIINDFIWSSISGRLGGAAGRSFKRRENPPQP